MKTLLFTLLVSTAVWGYGDNALYWVPHQCDEGKKAASAHGGHGRGESAMFAAMNLEGNASARLVLPDLSVKKLEMNLNTVMLPKPPMGGYYALVLNRQTPERIESAVRYLSLHGRPAKVSPTRLTALLKSALEIVPNPLHREHDRYTASKKYRFTVMFQGKPLPDTSVSLETRRSGSTSYRSDAKGNITLTLPNDFENVRVGRTENRPSEFLLTVRNRSGSTDYVSTLSMPYYVNPNDYWQSQELGAGAILIGFLGGMLLYRRTKKEVTHG